VVIDPAIVGDRERKAIAIAADPPRSLHKRRE
jgi:hypothetical protein